MKSLRTSRWRKAIVVGALPLALGALTGACADDDPDVVEDVDVQDEETVTDEDTVVDEDTEFETETETETEAS